MSPRLSVVIPCFNAGKYIGDLLDCCLRQSYEDWEVIVVDDGSTDSETITVLDEYRSKDRRISIINRYREPKGGDTCRNIGMEKARGEYLIIFDADDLISDDCFENRMRFMEENEDCDFASFPASPFFDGKPLPQKWNDTALKFGVKKGRHDNLYYLLTYNYPYTVWSNIYRRKSVEGIMWDEKILVMQDFDWMVSCELKGLKHKYSKVKKFDYYYRQFADGHSVCGSFIGKPKCQSTYYLFDKTLSRLRERNDYNQRKRQLFHYITVHLNRLLVGKEFEEVDKFLNLCNEHYATKEVLRLWNVSKKYKRMAEINNGVVTTMRMSYICLVVYKSNRYLIGFIKNLVKFIIGQKPVLN